MVSAMKLFEGRPGAANTVRSYGANGVTIGETLHALPLLLTASTVDASFSAAAIDALASEHIERVLTHAPEIVIAGSLGGLRHAPAAVRHAFESRRVALECMDLGAACRTFNVLVQEDRAVVALLFG